MIKLHVFDMDGTLVDNDCDVLWKKFLVDTGIAPKEDREKSLKYYADYTAGVLDVDAFVKFQHREFVGRTPDEMKALCGRCFETVLKANCRPKAVEWIRKVKATGAATVLLSGTNTVISDFIRAHFGLDRVCGTVLEVSPDGRFSGRVVGEYALGRGKVTSMLRVAGELGLRPDEVAAYGDSVNDIPLLAAAGEAYAVSPVAALRAEAEKRHWHIMEWA
jgi:HAD superfamily hydrolase (TIGR01490 family)